MDYHASPVNSSDDLSRALAAAGIEAPTRWFDEIGSTNEEAIAWAKQGAPEWSTVGAGHQTSGRGRLGRRWQDVAGGSLLLSFVLRPGSDPRRASLITLLAGASMAEAARDVAGVDARCRWPNDIMVGGAKVGGILAESSLEDSEVGYVVVGVGINLVVPSGVEDATGLGSTADAGALLTGFMRAFREGYPLDRDRGAHTLARWRALSATLGTDVEARFTDGTTVRGRAADVDEHGGLIIERADGRTSVTTGEVVHLR
jgi:BirA family transcriptional regulator, biotin operon repressor / biotin---[acetyl-CoA-carboxylase] ligase